jgi:hypothetical protein
MLLDKLQPNLTAAEQAAPTNLLHRSRRPAGEAGSAAASRRAGSPVSSGSSLARRRQESSGRGRVKAVYERVAAASPAAEGGNGKRELFCRSGVGSELACSYRVARCCPAHDARARTGKFGLQFPRGLGVSDRDGTFSSASGEGGGSIA